MLVLAGVYTMLSAYSPQPGSGESPTLPGALKGGPDVDTPAKPSPLHMVKHNR